MGEAIEPALKEAADPSRQIKTQEYSCCATVAAKYSSIQSLIEQIHFDIAFLKNFRCYVVPRSGAILSSD